ncbi:MAG: Hpt domain-containing protein [Steroidobacteraceae bacterium]|jgi:chemosensory pili system protein ChpA (sensor histidine kinase/response regulator)|nr:Hpt domain-containing protein [Steroidobacteraceae bacterium]
MTQVAPQTFDLVGRELSGTLNEARVALEAFVEQPDNLSLLERCAGELHRVQGVLRVLEIYGAALLAEEMEQVTRYLIATAADRRNHAESLDALLRAMVQLPAYLDRVLAGGRDLALVLLPLLNDLRAVRGSPLLSEGTLLLLNLKSEQAPGPAGPPPGEPDLSVLQWARRLRAQFQLGLVGWIRGERVADNLAALAQVAARMEQVARDQPVFQLWWVTGALIEALRDGGLEGSVSVKRLLGLADRELKRLYEQGEPRYCQNPPVELLNNLLYYVARTTSEGPRVTAVRRSFRLDELLPVDQAIDEARETLSAPSIKLMQTVAAAIREDLGKVKDTLDIFVRRGGGQPGELAPQLELLRKIGDTLGVLGLGELRGRIQGELGRLDDIVAGRTAPTEALLVEIATTLINIEDRLDGSLLKMIVPDRGGDGSPAGTGAPQRDGSGEVATEEFLHVQSAVLRECIVNLARIKDTIAQNVGGTVDAAGLDAWPELMRGIKAGLLMLGRTRAVAVVESIASCLRRVMQPGGTRLAASYLDRLADAIVSVEYYMETLEAGRAEPGYMLDNAQACLDALLAVPAAEAPAATPTLPPASFAQTVRLDPATARGYAPSPPVLGPAAPPPVDEPAAPATPESPIEPAQVSKAARGAEAPAPLEAPSGDEVDAGRQALGAPPVLAAADSLSIPPDAARGGAPPVGLLPDEVDPELLGVFIDEAREEVERIARYFPEWERNPSELESLRTVRRSFHTLKGSGRMVGASELAEFAWSIENLLNRLLDGTLERTPAVAATLREAVAVAPLLVDRLAGGPPVPMDVAALVARAHALASGQADVAAASGLFPALAPLAAAGGDPAEVPAGDAAAPSRPVGPEDGGPAAAPAEEPATWVGELPAAAAGAAPAVGQSPPPGAAAVAPDTAPEGALPASDEPAEDPLADTASREASALREIYLRETDAHVQTVRAFIEEQRHHGEPHRLTEAAYRACHTLSGSSKMAEQRHGIRLAEPLDHWLRRSWNSGAGLLTAELVLLEDCMEAMLQVARHPDESTAFFVAHDVLRGRIAGAEGELDRRLAAAAEAAAAAAAAAAGPPRTTSATADEAAEAFDPEIASIFTEEAAELLETIEGALQAWAGARDDAAALDALKRPLHTLKGGARMAGLRSMGDLSHELETAIGHIELGLVAPDARAVLALQAGVDELARMRDRVVAGHYPPQPHALIAQLRALADDAPAPAPAPDTALADGPVPDAEPGMASAAAEAPSPAVEVEPAAPAPESASAAVPEPDADVTVEQIELPSSLESEADEAQSVVTPEPAPAAAGEVRTEGGVEDLRAAVPAAQLAGLAVPPGREPVPQGDRPEMARVDAELLDQLLNNAGEVSIGRARLEQQVASLEHNLGELSRTVTRLKEQLRNLEIETEKQILTRYESEAAHRGDFDPLELDRYSSIQQFSRALAETASDVASIQQLLETQTQDTQNLLQQQARVVTELQNGLMRTRMVPFQRHVQRLSRIVRQAAADTGKRAELVVEGASGELDRQVLERMLPPFEHILRNAVVHGIEAPEVRAGRGKPEAGRITMSLRREGSEVIVEVADDGGGMDLAAIRRKGIDLGLIREDQAVSDGDAMQLVLEPGFSTAGRLTQHAGRGVGMDVVATEVKKLGGALHMDTRPGEGTRFTIRLPFTLAISHALVVRIEDELYALPLPTVEGVVRLPRAEVERHLAQDGASFDYSGHRYRLQQLGPFVGLMPSPLPAQDVTIPVVLVRAGDHSTGLVADELVGSREIVVKSVGPQISAIRGVSGATILGDGRIVIILDIGPLVRADWRNRVAPVAARDRQDAQPVALVVDDSITVRRVTQRLLERNGMKVLTARDGMDAIAVLAEHLPDVILLDIEMPRMDGYEVAAQVRNDPRTASIPIIMITSRVGDKHRARAIELGVDDYLGKPYQEAQLLEAIEPLVARRRTQAGAAGGQA